MNPVIQRELRNRARKKMTHLMRVLSGLLAALLVFSFFSAAQISPIRLSSNLGSHLFMALAVYALAFCLLAGVLLTADCLSEERREGTLLFLFLTELKVTDVVLGKFCAQSLNAFYSLVAILPLMALPIVLGGVTGSEVGRMTLALINLLFFSLTAGMWVSSICEEWQQAMGRTGAVMLAAGLLLLVRTTHFGQAINVIAPLLSVFSPVETFYFAFSGHYLLHETEYWISLVISHVIGWQFLRLAIIQTSCQKDGMPQQAENVFSRFFRALNRSARRNTQRAKLFETDPLLWLINGSSELRITIWVLAIVGGVTMIVSYFCGPLAIMVNHIAGVPAYFLFKILFAVQACRFFSEARRNGSLELICCTPLEGRRLISVQWDALAEMFLYPTALLAGAQLLSGALQMTFFNNGMNDQAIYSFFFSLYETAKLAADIMALGWLGIWLSLTFKKPAWSGPLTIFFLLVLPVGIIFVPDVVLDLCVITWVKRKLQTDARLIIAHQGQPRARQKFNFSFYKTAEAS